MKRTIFFLFTVLIISINTHAQKQVLTGKIGKFENAASLSINPAGFIYICDAASNEIIKLDTLGNVKKFIGGYGWDESSFDEPVDIFATTLNVFVADKNNDRVQIFDKDLNFLSQFNSSDIDDQTRAFRYPASCATSNQGDLFILDSDNARVIKYDFNGNFLLIIGGNDAGSFKLTNPKKFAISPGGRIFVIDGEQIFIFDQFGNGISKLRPGFEADNINITFNMLTITSRKEIIYTDLSDKQTSFKKFSVPGNESITGIKEAAIYKNRFYILKSDLIEVYYTN